MHPISTRSHDPLLRVFSSICCLTNLLFRIEQAMAQMAASFSPFSPTSPLPPESIRQRFVELATLRTGINNLLRLLRLSLLQRDLASITQLLDMSQTLAQAVEIAQS